MAWLAVDEDGSLYVYENKPYRIMHEWCGLNFNSLLIPKWMEEFVLRGSKLTWEDEPVEI